LPTLHVSPLSRLDETVAAVRARHLVTLINVGTTVARPAGIAPERHLFLGMSDISQTLDGHVLAGQEHMTRLLAFLRDWDHAEPMVIHCWAGISRSTASAFTAMCLYNPDVDELKLAQQLRSLSHVATPNRRIVAFADDIMGRQGRMVDAVDAIGRGEDAFEGVIFQWKM